MKHDVFISYSSKNKAAADAICHVLENNGIKCWMAPRDIPAGSEYGDLIDVAIKEARVLVVVFSETAASSRWVKGELNIAFEEQKVIIPYRIDSTPFSGQNRVILNHKHWIDAYPDYKTKFNDLVEAVNGALGRTGQMDISKKDVRPGSKSQNRKIYYGQIIIFIVVICVLILSVVLFINRKNTYSYDKNGLTITNLENITSYQAEVLTEILDNMVLVNEGSFTMGNNYVYEDYITELDSMSSPSHSVTLSSFYISNHELTQKEIYAFIDGFYSLEQEVLDDNQPADISRAVDNISWEEANAFTILLSELTGLNFSLPTEAQWEFAAGGGESNNRYIYAGFEDGINHYSWTHADELKSAALVKQRLPNNLGLYDMTGNVSEWCLDNYAEYPSSPQVNPIVSVDNNKKIYRGGDFTTPNVLDMKITTRYFAPEFAKRKATGVRLVINKPNKQQE